METFVIEENTAQRDMNEQIAKFVKERNITIERLTQDQVAEAFRQAILSGDFMRYVVMDGSSQAVESRQAVDYIPYREVFRLKARIKELEEKLCPK